MLYSFTIMTISFVKMHGIGNDFVIIDGRVGGFKPTEKFITQICDRHTGVGCDQFVLLEKSKKADVFVRFFNPDGSESGACGNASRCVGWLIMAESGDDEAKIETRAGVLEVKRAGKNRVSVNMGRARTKAKEIPLAKNVDTFALPIEIDGLPSPFAVSMGNPHAVFFIQNVKKFDVEKYGKYYENHKIFPERTNVEFAEIKDRGNVTLRVWERGAGETMACGSGACATAFAGYKKGLLDSVSTVKLPGGKLVISIDDNDNVIMTGPAELVFEGVLR